MPSYGVYIIIYEWIANKVVNRANGEIPTPLQSVLMGGSAGWLAAFALTNIL